MIEQVAEGIYRIGVPLPNNPLRELNSYYIPGEERDLVIDTGFHFPECRDALFAGLKELGSVPERRDVYLTHFHSDHSGMALECAGENGRIYISRTDYTYLEWSLSGLLEKQNYVRLSSEGFPKDELLYANAHNMAFRSIIAGLDDRVTRVEEGDIIRAGGYALQVVLVPGHTPGNTMLWDAERKIMFTGDHVLFDISPNITSWYGVDDALALYLDSLKKAQQCEVEVALPGHRKGGNYAARVQELLEHHEKRLDEALRTVIEHPGLTGYEITAQMTWRIRARSWQEFPAVQKCFAVREALAHLDYLRLRSKVRREQGEIGWGYFAV